MKPITSVRNLHYREAVQLLRTRGRRRQSRFAIHGTREIQRALRSNIEIDEVFCCSANLNCIERQCIDELAGRPIPIWDVTPTMMRQLQYGDREGRVMVVARPPATDLSQIQLGSNPLVVVVESLEKPGNIGAVLRSADAVGVDAVILANPVCEHFHPNVIRTSTGCVFTQSIAATTSSDAKQWLHANGLYLVGTARRPSKSIHRPICASRPR